MSTRATTLALALLLLGCRAPKPAPVPPAPPEPWDIVCATPPPQGIYLSNGALGFKAGPGGDGRDGNGMPGPLFRADAYADKAITTLPNPFLLDITIDEDALRPATDYRQTLNMRNGLLTTDWRQRTQGGVGVRAHVEMFLDRHDPTVGAVRYTLDLTEQATVVVNFNPHSKAEGVRGTGSASGGIYRWSGPAGDTLFQTETRGRQSSFGWERVEGSWQQRAAPGAALIVEHVVRYGKAAGPIPTFDEAFSQSSREWERLWQSDIEVEGDVGAQQRIRSWLFNIYQSLGAGFLPPMGFSSDIYGGRTFWDQETWMLPALLPLQPCAVKEILTKRLAIIGKSGPPFPWESTPEGEEGAPPEFQKEIHISGDVVFAAELARDWGIDLPNVGKSVAAYYTGRLSGGQIRGVISPDEGELVDNDLYTNALAKWCLERYGDRRLSEGIRLPEAGGMYRTYDKDPGKAYKQAAALLAVYPLNLNMADDVRVRMFDFYKDKAIPSGPAMTDAIHCVIAAKLGRTEEAWSFFQRSYQGFVAEPGLQFSEKKKGTMRTYFLTGAGGCLQAVLFGFAGLSLIRSDSVEPTSFGTWEGVGKAVSKAVGEGYTLVVRPHLPKAWTALTLKGVHVRGKRFTIKITHEGVSFSK